MLTKTECSYGSCWLLSILYPNTSIFSSDTSFLLIIQQSSILTKIHSDPQGQTARWMVRLAAFDFEIMHRPEKQHTNADGMSQECQRVSWRVKWARPDRWQEVRGCKALRRESHLYGWREEFAWTRTFCWKNSSRIQIVWTPYAGLDKTRGQ